MRCGEMLALRWKDVDWKEGYLTIEKSRSMAKTEIIWMPVIINM